MKVILNMIKLSETYINDCHFCEIYNIPKRVKINSYENLFKFVSPRTINKNGVFIICKRWVVFLENRLDRVRNI